MPLDIPSEPKVYTSVYDNFKGVDFTNDPSNVYRRRSPSGRNMLPDLDGRPFKRHGWKIDVSDNQFIELASPQITTLHTTVEETISALEVEMGIIQEKIEAGTATSDDIAQFKTDQIALEFQEQDKASLDILLANIQNGVVVPYRLYYFELGGIDYILVYNSLGVFTYDGDELEYISEYVDKDGGEQFFPISAVSMMSDSKRGFFYEANGIAGQYLFNGGKMFRLQMDTILEDDTYVDKLVLHEVVPFIPTTHIGCDPATGAGTDYQPVNILSRRRKKSFTRKTGAEATRYYKILEGIQNDNFVLHPERMPRVWVNGEEKYHGSGDDQWLINTNTYDTIVFKNAPTAGVESEDNVVIEYIARNELQDSTKVLKAGTFNLARNNDGSWGYLDGEFENVGSGEYSIFSTQLSVPKYSAINVTLDASGVSDRSRITVFVRNQGTPNLWTWIDHYGLTPEQIFTMAIDPYSSKVYFTSNNSAIWNSNMPYKSDTVYTKGGKTGHRRVYEFKFEYLPQVIEYNEVQRAFFDCSKFAVYGTGLVNQVFACGTTIDGYKSRLWYSRVGQPEYFPETNYTEVGSNDTAIMGTLKCGEYLGVVKQGKTTDTSVYLAYPTSFEDITTYAVKQSISGIGAISNGAFNVLNEEPLFLSADGVMGIELSGEEHRLRSRSHFINGRLTKEAELSTAISFVFDNMYWLAVGGNCYVLDGTQKSSWANEKTNLQYECYYLENIPAQCFAKMDDVLYWSDFYGNLCKFKTDTDENMYMDSYSLEELPSDNDKSMFRCASQPIDGKIPVDSVLDLCKRLIRISYAYWGETADLRVQTRSDFFDTFMLNDTIFSNRQWQYSLSGWSLVNYGYMHSVVLPMNLAMEMTVTGANGVSYVCTTQPSIRVIQHGALGYEYEIYLEGDPTGTNQNGVAGDSHGTHIGMLTEPFTVEFVVSFDSFNFLPRGNYEFYIGDYVCCGGDPVTYGYDDLDRNHYIPNSYGNIQSLRAVDNFDVCRVESFDEDYLYVSENICNVDAVWSTLADDDGMVHYFKNMKKKGCLVSLLPESDTGVEVWLKADEKEPVKIGETDVKGQTLPFEFYIKKKVKKYKRLQIICKNGGANDGFGIDQIIKSYTVGNYSKKRG